VCVCTHTHSHTHTRTRTRTHTHTMSIYIDSFQTCNTSVYSKHTCAQLSTTHLRNLVQKGEDLDSGDETEKSDPPHHMHPPHNPESPHSDDAFTSRSNMSHRSASSAGTQNAREIVRGGVVLWPMDMETVEARVVARQYSVVEELQFDVMLVAINV